MRETHLFDVVAIPQLLDLTIKIRLRHGVSLRCMPPAWQSTRFDFESEPGVSNLTPTETADRCLRLGACLWRRRPAISDNESHAT